MLEPIVRSLCVDLASVVAGCFPQTFDTDNHVGTRVVASRSKRSQISEDIDPLAAHALLDLEFLFLDTRPVLVHRIDLHVGIAEFVIVVCRILIKHDALELKARRRHVRNDPLTVPNRIQILAHGGSAKRQPRILLMALRQVNR